MHPVAKANTIFIIAISKLFVLVFYFYFYILRNLRKLLKRNILRHYIDRRKKGKKKGIKTKSPKHKQICTHSFLSYKKRKNGEHEGLITERCSATV